MKAKLINMEKNNYPKIGLLLKKNLDFIFLICTVLLVIIFVQVFNYIKNEKKNHFFDVFNNIYFEKTLHAFVDNLESKYINVKHKISSGENFNGILKKYEIPEAEIRIVKKFLSKKENLNKLKKDLIINFTLDLENSKKVISLTYPLTRTKKIQIVRNSE